MKYSKLLMFFIFLSVFILIGYKILMCKSNNDVSIVRIAVVNSDEIISKSLALQSMQERIKEQSSILQEQFEAELDKFRISENEFELLSEEAKNEKTEQFNKQVINAKDNYNKQILYLEKSYKDVIDSTFNKIKEVVKEIAEKNNISLVLYASKSNQVLYSIDNFNFNKVDLSDLVLKSINREILN